MTDLRRLEDQVTEVLRRQADGIDVRPRPELGAAMVPLTGSKRSRRRWPIVAVPAAAVVGVVVAVVTNLGSTPADRLVTSPADEETPAPKAITTTTTAVDHRAMSASLFHAVTGHAALESTGVAIEAGGQRFQAHAPIDVHSDPGQPNAYTTLEITWTEHDVEMRLYLYFASDGQDWWATEIRTYNGASPGDWITYTGEFFRTPLGQPFAGDVDLRSDDGSGRLQLPGLRLRAFLVSPNESPSPVEGHSAEATTKAPPASGQAMG